MYRNGRNRRDASGDDGNSFKSLLILSGIVVAIAAVAFLVTYITYNAKLQQSTTEMENPRSLASFSGNTIAERTSTSIGKNINEVKNEMNVVNVTELMNNMVNSVVENTVAVQKNEEVSARTKTNIVETRVQEYPVENEATEVETNAIPVEEEVKKDPSFIKPVEGEIIRDFAKESLVFSKTLDEWITHLGIDIKTDKTTVVKAAADGMVETIKNDPRYGLTVIVSHDNGFKTIYSNLLTAEFVVEGENLTSGQTIGTVGNNAAFEIADDPHLHFEMSKDGEKVDPKIYIRF